MEKQHEIFDLTIMCCVLPPGSHLDVLSKGLPTQNHRIHDPYDAHLLSLLSL